MRVRFPLALALGCCVAGCGGSSSTAPTHTPTPPAPTAPTTITLTGRVTATNGGQALAGLQAAVGTTTVATDASGGFAVQTAPAATLALALTGSGIVPRSVFLAAGSSRTVAVEAIAVAGFDLNFYRQLVRNGYEAPATLQPLRRWTRAPQVYVRTIDNAGNPIDMRTLNTAENAIRETAGLFTGGRFGVASVERGTETRAGTAGWITVVWPSEADPTACGRADVGREGGTIELNYKTGGGCRCPGVSEVSPRAIRHELGHAMGFWHTDAPTDLMSNLGTAGCDLLPSSRERAAAAIAYARPVGNVDPDTDSAGTVTLAPMQVR